MRNSRLAMSAVIAVIMLQPTGCALPAKPATSVQVLPPDAPPALSDAEKARRFDTAYRQGLDLIRDGNYGLALGAFEAALLMDPNSTQGLFNLAACHEGLGDPFRAMAIYRRLLEIDPNDADCYANIGTCCIKLYHRERTTAWREMAREAWRHSLDLRPDQPDLRKFLAAATSGE